MYKVIKAFSDLHADASYGRDAGRKADPHHVVAGNDRHADPGIL